MAAIAIFRHIRDKDINAIRKVLSSFDEAAGCKDPQGRYPLHVACQIGSLEAVRELLRSKCASCEATDSHNNLPLHIAAEQGSVELVTELLVPQSGRRVTLFQKKNKNGQTVLHLAAATANPDLISVLLAAGAKNNVKDSSGSLPHELVPSSAPTFQQAVDLLLSPEPPTSPGYAASRLPDRRASACPVPLTQHTTAANGSGSSSEPGTGPAAAAAVTGAPDLAPPSLTFCPAPSPPNAKTPPSMRSARGGAASAIPGVLRQSANLQRGAGILAAKAAGSPALGQGATPASAAPVPPQSTFKTPSPAAIINQSATSSRPVGAQSTARASQPASANIPPIVAQLAAELEALRARLDTSQEATEADAMARREMEEALLQSQATVKAQAERLEEMEARLAHAEQRGRDLAGRMECIDNEHAQQSRHFEEAIAHKDPAVRVVSEQVASLQAGQGAVQEAVARMRKNVDSVMEAIATQKTTTEQNIAPGVPSSRGPSAEVLELTGQIQALSARVTSTADVDGLRARINKIEALNAGDHLELLALRSQQLSANVASLTSAQQEAAEKLAAVQRWQADHPLRDQEGGDSGRGSGGGWRPEAGQPGALSMATTLVRVEVRLAEIESQRAQESAAQEQQRMAQEALKQALDTLQEQVTQITAMPAPSVPATPAPPTTPLPLTPSGTARRAALASAAAASAADDMEEVHAGLNGLHRDVASLSSAVEELRAGLGVVTGNLRREWEAAVAEAGRRAAESAAELAQKEARVKAMRDAVLAEGDVQASMSALEQRLTAALKGVDTRLGLLQHKVEVVEEQQESLMLRSPSRPTAGPMAESDENSNLSYRTLQLLSA